jgi:hypothetical protein
VRSVLREALMSQKVLRCEDPGEPSPHSAAKELGGAHTGCSLLLCLLLPGG